MCTKGNCSYETNVRLFDGRQVCVLSICPEVAKELAQMKLEENRGFTVEGYDRNGRYIQFHWNEVLEVLSEFQGKEATGVVH